MRKTVRVLAGLCLGASATAAAPGATFDWIGGQDADSWAVAANWRPASVPGSGDSVRMLHYGSNTRPARLVGDATIGGWLFEAGAVEGNGALTVTGAALLRSPDGVNMTRFIRQGASVSFQGGVEQQSPLSLDGSVTNGTSSVYRMVPGLSTISAPILPDVTGTGTFLNAGTFVADLYRPDGYLFEASVLRARFDNAGEVQVASGRLLIVGGGQQAGVFRIADGAELGFSTWSAVAPLEFQPGASIVNNGTLLGAGATIAGPGVAYSGNGAIHATDALFTIDLAGPVQSRRVLIDYRGTLQATSGIVADTLVFNDGALGGTLEVLGAATIDRGQGFANQRVLSGATLTLRGGAVHAGYGLAIDGTLVNAAGSTFTAAGTQSSSGNTGSWITGSGRLLNQGLFVQDARGERTNVFARLDNEGQLQVMNGILGLRAPGNHTGSFAVAVGGMLEFGGGMHQLSGSGASIFNEGVVAVVTDGSLTLEAQQYSGGGSLWVAGGLLHVGQGARISAPTLTVSSGLLNVRGELQTVQVGAVTGEIAVRAGGVLLVQPGAELLFDRGRLQVHGLVVADLVRLRHAGMIAAGEIQGDLMSEYSTVAVGQQYGRLAVSGDYTQRGLTSYLSTFVGGTEAEAQYGVLAIGGTAALGGWLDVNFMPGYLPGEGASFELVRYGALLGQFDGHRVWGLDPGYTYAFDYGAGALTLTITAVPEPATLATLVVGLALVMLRRRQAGAS